jgi:uncharacterized protein YbaR (Trm112 family)
MTILNDDRRVELESKLQCPKCSGVPFLVYRRQNQQPDGQLLPSYETVLWPNGSGVLPPQHGEKITCRDCRVELVRVAP